MSFSDGGTVLKEVLLIKEKLSRYERRFLTQLRTGNQWLPLCSEHIPEEYQQTDRWHILTLLTLQITPDDTLYWLSKHVNQVCPGHDNKYLTEDADLCGIVHRSFINSYAHHHHHIIFVARRYTYKGIRTTVESSIVVRPSNSCFILYAIVQCIASDGGPGILCTWCWQHKREDTVLHRHPWGDTHTPCGWERSCWDSNCAARPVQGRHQPQRLWRKHNIALCCPSALSSVQNARSRFLLCHGKSEFCFIYLFF